MRPGIGSVKAMSHVPEALYDRIVQIRREIHRRPWRGRAWNPLHADFFQAHGPADHLHGPRVEPEGARCLTITSGGDFENMIREMAEPATTTGLPPQVEPTPAMIIALYEACARNGIEIIGSPLS